MQTDDMVSGQSDVGHAIGQQCVRWAAAVGGAMKVVCCHRPTGNQ